MFFEHPVFVKNSDGWPEVTDKKVKESVNTVSNQITALDNLSKLINFYANHKIYEHKYLT